MSTCRYCFDDLHPGVNIGEEDDSGVCDNCWDEMTGNDQAWEDELQRRADQEDYQ